MGNDWYPVVIDTYVTAEYASLDAYLASEYGQILLASCGVSALVPLATATQRLADNGINITVHNKKGLYKRNSGGSIGLIVDSNGQAARLNIGSVNNYLYFDVQNPTDLNNATITNTAVAALVEEYGNGQIIGDNFDVGFTVICDGIQYTFREGSAGLYLDPNPPAWT